MNIQKTPHEWSKDALFSKAQRYVEEMFSQERSSWQFGFWSALSLEMLARASLAQISPALLADGKDWNNILYAVGTEPNQKKFIPKSADINLLLAKAENTFSSFTTEMLNFSIIHITRRNSELHSGSLPFDDIGTSTWLPMYYTTCECLLEQLGESLTTLFGTGSPVGQIKTSVDEEGIEEKQAMLPTHFECVACGLKISGYSRLLACGLGDTFISTTFCDAVEYFNIDVVEMARDMLAEDNNEPY